MWNRNGYTSLFKQAPTCDSEWENVSSACHKLTKEIDDKNTYDQTPQLNNNLRESHENTREVNSITFQDKYFETLKMRLIPSNFSIQRYKENLEDSDVETVYRKQARLYTIHEKLGNLSFHRLKLLAIEGIIPKEPSNVDAPVNVVRIYGYTNTTTVT